MGKLIDLLKKYILNKEMILYLIMGVLTTLVNWATHALCVNPISSIISNESVALTVTSFIAWTAGVLFAFFTNKIWVFESKSWAPRVFWKEFISFVLARAFTGLFEIFGVPFLVAIGLDQKIFGIKAMFAKVLVSVIVIVLNYVFSKLFIFKKKEKNNEDTQRP
ncbi:MAG: GtrA family protein [Eubacterium sp.]|nr:GtrA family protein [Eubacterium sp.]